MIVEGQIQGAVAQGTSAALFEELVYDPETGQLVDGTMVDYFMPTAADLPAFELDHPETPSPVTPFGIRGVGEGGTIAAAAAITNAVCDALSPFGVELDSVADHRGIDLARPRRGAREGLRTWRGLRGGPGFIPARRTMGGVGGHVGAPHGKDRRLQIRETFTVEAPPATVWKFFEDIERVARCVPGVQSVDVLGRPLQGARHPEGRLHLGHLRDGDTGRERIRSRSLALSSVGKSIKGAIGNLRSKDRVDFEATPEAVPG